MSADFLTEALSLEAYTTALRREFHTYPECMPEEQIHTMERVERELDRIGIPYERIPSGGIFGYLDGSQPGKTLLMRADLDALPITEDPCNLAGARTCVSVLPGVMHACGHDAHMAMLLTAARMLKQRIAGLPGRIILMFEEGEEGGGNISTLLRVIDERQLRIDSAYACHVRWDIPSGMIGITDGTAMFGLCHFALKVHGSSAHGSRPDQGKNAIDCFVQICSAWQTLRMTALRPDAALTYSVCTVKAGHTHNVLPDELTAQGTIRFSEPKDRQLFFTRMREMAAGIAEIMGCTAELEQVEYLSPVRTDPAHQSLLRASARAAVGEEHVFSPEPWMASETFSNMTDLYPSAFAFVGIRDEAYGSGAGHHTPQFDVDEHALPYGAAAAAAYAEAYLSSPPDASGFEPAAPSIREYILMQNA